MSSVFKTPKVKEILPEEISPYLVDKSELYFELEKKRQKKMGAVSQLLAKDNTYGLGISSANIAGGSNGLGGGKLTLGG